jgi:hypothetical protein
MPRPQGDTVPQGELSTLGYLGDTFETGCHTFVFTRFGHGHTSIFACYYL